MKEEEANQLPLSSSFEIPFTEAHCRLNKCRLQPYIKESAPSEK